MFLPLALAAVVAPPAPPAPAKFEIRDGDRIVWIGNTLVEREQRYGYWETALHAAFPDKSFTLRNLGWSGDTVFGDARAGFDTPAKGFERLVGLTLELKPTVIFVSYGTNESFEGEAGLPKFEAGLGKLLDALKPANARVVLFTPTPFEESTFTGDFRKRTESLSQYAKVIRGVAEKRQAFLADLLATGAVPLAAAKSAAPSLHLTENGMHLTGAGYQEFAQMAFLVALKVDGTGEADLPKLESLRQAVVAKNQLFFYRWRPQNETYLFGFRKHEQRKNAKEVAEFDPLVAKAEEEIEALRKQMK